MLLTVLFLILIQTVSVSADVQTVNDTSAWVKNKIAFYSPAYFGGREEQLKFQITKLEYKYGNADEVTLTSQSDFNSWSLTDKNTSDKYTPAGIIQKGFRNKVLNSDIHKDGADYYTSRNMTLTQYYGIQYNRGSYYTLNGAIPFNDGTNATFKNQSQYNSDDEWHRVGFDYGSPYTGLMCFPYLIKGINGQSYCGSYDATSIESFITSNKDFIITDQFQAEGQNTPSDKPLYLPYNCSQNAALPLMHTLSLTRQEAGSETKTVKVYAKAKSTSSTFIPLYRFQLRHLFAYYDRVLGSTFKSIAQIAQGNYTWYIKNKAEINAKAGSGVTTYAIDIIGYIDGQTLKVTGDAAPSGDPGQVAVEQSTTKNYLVGTHGASVWSPNANSSSAFVDFIDSTSLENEGFVVFNQFASEDTTNNTLTLTSLSQWLNKGDDNRKAFRDLLNILWLDGYFVAFRMQDTPGAPSSTKMGWVWYVGMDSTESLYTTTCNVEDAVQAGSGGFRKIPRDSYKNIEGLFIIKDDREGDGAQLLPSAGTSYQPEVTGDGLQTLGGTALDVQQNRFAAQITEWMVRNGLLEGNLNNLLPDKENLKMKDLYSLNNWIDATEKESVILRVLRIVVQVVGIIVFIWSILLYMAYWFDRMNNFVPIPILPILTFGKLVVSDTEESCTFDDKTKGRVHTVNHKAILKVCIISAIVSASIMTGLFYKFIWWVAFKIKGIFS